MSHLVQTRWTQAEARRAWGLGPSLACAGALSLLVSCGPKPPAEPGPNPATTNTAVLSTGVVKPEFAKLLGKWARPDGDYVLEIKEIDPAGKLEAGYFNPDPIKVAQARALRDGEVTKVFVELRDVNYPGCTYSLSYDPQHDQLFGTYFQAALNQTYDITFGRMH